MIHWDKQTSCKLGILLTPGFCSLHLTLVIEALKLANEAMACEEFEWQTYALNDRMVRSDLGVNVMADQTYSSNNLPDAHLKLIVLTNTLETDLSANSSQILNQLREQRIDHTILNTRTLIPNDTHATTEGSQSLTASRKHNGVCDTVKVILNLVGQQGGQKVALCVLNKLSHHFDLGSLLQSSREIQNQVEGASAEYAKQPKLAEAIALMENNLEEPLPLDDLANYIHLSRRQLERLFQRHLQCSPSRYYLRLRVARAQSMLRETQQSIVSIANKCGFVSMPHFSKVYREQVGMAPRDERRSINVKRTDKQPKSPVAFHEQLRYSSAS